MKKEHMLLSDKFVLKDTKEKNIKRKLGAVREAKIGKGRFDLLSPYALLRVARIYEKGAVKYTIRNMEKGLEFSTYLDSLLRHIIEYMMGMTDEDHLAQAMWNVMQLLHQEALIDFKLLPPELNDLPQYQQRKSIEDFVGFLNKLDKEIK